MSKKVSNTSTLNTTSTKSEVKEEVKIENHKLDEVQKVRPGSFAELISQ
jgi:hypothetical protein